MNYSPVPYSMAAPIATTEQIRSITVHVCEKRPQTVDHLTYLRHLVFKCSKISLQALLQSHYRSIVFEGLENQLESKRGAVGGQRYDAQDTRRPSRVERLISTGACLVTPVAGQKSVSSLAFDLPKNDSGNVETEKVKEAILNQCGNKLETRNSEDHTENCKLKQRSQSTRPQVIGSRTRSASSTDAKRKGLMSLGNTKPDVQGKKSEPVELRSSVLPKASARGSCQHTKSSTETNSQSFQVSNELSKSVVLKKPEAPQLPEVTKQRTLSVIHESIPQSICPSISTPEALESVILDRPVGSVSFLSSALENEVHNENSPIVGKLTIRRSSSVLGNGLRSIRKRLPSFYYDRQFQEDDWSSIRETSASLARHNRNLQKIRALRLIEEFGTIPSPERISVDRTVHGAYRDNWASILRIKFVTDHWVPSAYVNEHYSKFHKPPFQPNGNADDKKITQSITIILKLSNAVIQDE